MQGQRQLAPPPPSSDCSDESAAFILSSDSDESPASPLANAAAARLLSPDLLGDGPTASSAAAAAAAAAAVGVVGTGTQVQHQLRYLKCVTDCRRALVWGRTGSNVRKFIEDMSAEGWDVWSVGDANDLLGSCGLIVMTMSLRAPLLGAGSAGLPGPDGAAHRPLHVTYVGSDSTGKKELDSRLQTAEQGECVCVLTWAPGREGRFQY